MYQKYPPAASPLSWGIHLGLSHHNYQKQVMEMLMMKNPTGRIMRIVRIVPSMTMYNCTVHALLMAK